MLEKRFTSEYAAAFHEWLATDPFTNPDAPAGPGYMPSFENPAMAKAAELNAQASADFATGTEARRPRTGTYAKRCCSRRSCSSWRSRSGSESGACGSPRTRWPFGLLAYTLYGVGSLPRI
jgi:hypothetical protein